MNLLRLLSGLVTWVWRRKPRKRDGQTASWYESTPRGEWCGSDTRCDACRTDGDCDFCDTIDGRHMDAVAEHAQTCDSCGDLTENEGLTMHPGTHLSYCERCLRQGAGEDWAYKVWECDCGAVAVYTDTDLERQRCPGCGEPMMPQFLGNRRLDQHTVNRCAADMLREKWVLPAQTGLSHDFAVGDRVRGGCGLGDGTVMGCPTPMKGWPERVVVRWDAFGAEFDGSCGGRPERDHVPPKSLICLTKYELWVACSRGGRCTEGGLHGTCEADSDRHAAWELIAQAYGLLGSYDHVQCTITADGREVVRKTISSGAVPIAKGDKKCRVS